MSAMFVYIPVICECRVIKISSLRKKIHSVFSLRTTFDIKLSDSYRSYGIRIKLQTDYQIMVGAMVSCLFLDLQEEHHHLYP